MRDPESNQPSLLTIVSKEWTDTEIVEGVRAGEVAAATALHERYATLIETLVWRMLGPDTEHQDVVQQVFLCIAESIDRQRKPEALRSWIHGITVNTVRNELRRRQRSASLSTRTPVADARDPGPGPDSGALAERFYQVLAVLEPDDRIAIALRYVEGRPLAEVAEACGCSLATIKRRLKVACSRFCDLAQQDFWLARALEEANEE